MIRKETCLVELKRVCGKCGNPTANNIDVYRDGKTGAEVLDCPKCGFGDKKDIFVYTFADGWKLLKGSGVSKQVTELGNAYLKLVKVPLEEARRVQQLVEIPEEIRRQLIEKAEKAQQILRESGVEEELRKMRLGVEVHTMASISI